MVEGGTLVIYRDSGVEGEPYSFTENGVEGGTLFIYRD